MWRHVKIDSNVNRLKVNDWGPPDISSEGRLEAALSDWLFRANTQFGRLTVSRPQAWVLQDPGMTVRIHEVHRGRRNCDKEIAAADLPQSLNTYAIVWCSCSSTGSRSILERDGRPGRRCYTERLVQSAIHFHHCHFNQNFGLSFVDGLQDFFRHGDF